jgi:penicillin amidase
MELNRRAARGTLSAVFGQRTLETDILSRTMGFARLAEVTLAHLHDDTRADLAAYTAGINAFLQSQQPLPQEFGLVRHQPEAWQPLDTIAYSRLQMWALSQGSSAEIVMAQLKQLLGTEAARELMPVYPADNPITLPQGTIEMNGQTTPHSPFAVASFFGKGSLDGVGRGSNAWVIGPERSASGHAILCNDMHLPVLTPSLWHFQHLHSDDGFHVTGFTLPGLPYVMVGHNTHIAWGITLSFVDCEDYFVEKFHRNNPTLYEFKGEWRQAQIIREEIAVRGQEAHTEQVTITHHGPITPLNSPLSPLAYCATALQADIQFDGFGRLNEARDWDGFVTAIARIEAPSLNILYADVQDNIGYYVTGHAPVRAAGDGLQPAPGWTGTHEWVGTIPFAEMPHALNPAQGYIVSANHRIAGDEYPHYLGQMWRNGYRARRIEQLITSQDTISVADCQRFHMDTFSLPGTAVTAQLAHLQPLEPEAQLSLRLLREWDGWLKPDSVGGTVYEVFLHQLALAVLSPHLDKEAMGLYLGVGEHPVMSPLNEFAGYWATTVVRWLSTPQTKWLPSGLQRERVLEVALAQTTAVLHQTLGDDHSQWQWGRLHRVSFPHALGVIRPFDTLLNQGPFPIGGDADTVLQTGIRPDAPYDNNAVSVSSRHIVDMGDIDGALAMLVPGQSGHPASPHYGSLIEPWLNGRYFSMGFGGEINATETLNLLPAIA